MTKKNAEVRTLASPLSILVAGDLTALLLFVLIGRTGSHGMPFSLLQSLPTAVPFAAGWIIASAMLRGYRSSAVSAPVKAVLSSLIICCLAVPIGLLFRSLWLWRPPGIIFALVAFPLTALFMSSWRLLFALAFGKLNRRGR
jgi:hypothetical protein